MDLSSEPAELLAGLSVYQNTENHSVCVLLHYSADPQTASEEARRSGMATEAFEREHNLSFEVHAGKPVFGTSYSPGEHESYNLLFVPELPVWRAWDFGYHRPAVVFSQVYADGTWAVLGEILGENQTLIRFIEDTVQPYCAEWFPKARFIDVADPAGRQVTDKSEHTSFTILGLYKIWPMARRSEIDEGLALIFRQLDLKQFRLNVLYCPVLKGAFRGGYRYPNATASVPNPKLPCKDGYFDHVLDCLRYTAIHAFSWWTAPPKVEPKEETLVDRYLRNKQKWDEDAWYYGE